MRPAASSAFRPVAVAALRSALDIIEAAEISTYHHKAVFGSPSPVVPIKTMDKPAFAHLTTCLASASWSISSFPGLKGVVRGTPGPFGHLGRG